MKKAQRTECRDYVAFLVSYNQMGWEWGEGVIQSYKDFTRLALEALNRIS